MTETIAYQGLRLFVTRVTSVTTILKATPRLLIFFNGIQQEYRHAGLLQDLDAPRLLRVLPQKTPLHRDPHNQGRATVKNGLATVDTVRQPVPGLLPALRLRPTQKAEKTL